jgi:hypothetical protein
VIFFVFMFSEGNEYAPIQSLTELACISQVMFSHNINNCATMRCYAGKKMICGASREKDISM